MELLDLRGDERLALVALLKVAVVADGSVSDEKIEEISDVVEAFGEGEYRKLVDEVSRRFQSPADLKTFLETIQRPEARELSFLTRSEPRLAARPLRSSDRSARPALHAEPVRWAALFRKRFRAPAG